MNASRLTPCLTLLAALLFIVCAAFAQPSTTPASQPRPSHLRTGVVPEPQQVFELPGARPFSFSNNTRLVIQSEEDRLAAELIAQRLKDAAGLDLPISPSTTSPDGGPYIFISRVDPAVPDPRPLRPEGYRLRVDENRILIDAADARGAIYGAQTLRQLIRPNLTVAPIAILDWPQMPIRANYGGFAGGVNDRADIERFVASASMAKLNMLLLETPWSGHANWWFNPDGGRRELAQYFMDLCRKYHIEPVPVVQGPGWGYGVTDRDVMTAEGVWIQNEPLILHHDRPTELAQRNVIVTESAPIIVKSEDGKTQYTQDKDYRILPGETGRPYPATNKPWSLQLIPTGQIADGQRVLVSYNHVTPNVHKAYCLSEPRAIKIALDAIDQVMTTYHPKFIHLGFDEVWDLDTDSRCLQSGKTPQELIYNHLMQRYQRVKSHDSEATVIIWGDMLRPVREGVSNGILHDRMAQLPKDLLVAPWLYSVKEEDRPVLLGRVKNLADAGFGILGVPSGYFMTNSLDWYRALAPHLQSGVARGMMFTDWGGSLDASCMTAAAELMWSGNRTLIPLFNRFETLTNNLKRRGLALTFPLRSQGPAIAKIFNDATLAGAPPAQAAEQFNREVFGDDAIFRQTYGKNRWDDLANCADYTNHAAMAHAIPLFMSQVARYLEAEHLHSQGEGQAAQTLRDILSQLHRLGYLTRAQADELAEKSTHQWLSSADLLGFELSSYRPAAQGAAQGLVTPVDPAQWKLHHENNQLRLDFVQPLPVVRLQSPDLKQTDVQVQPDGDHAPITLHAQDGVLTLAGEPVRSLSWSTANAHPDLKIFEVRPKAEIRSTFVPQLPALSCDFDQPPWIGAARIGHFLTEQGSQALWQTQVLLTHDSQNLYIGFICHQPPDAPLQTAAPSGPIWDDDSVQIFLDTDQDPQTYCQIVANAAGALWEKAESTGPDHPWSSGARVQTRRRKEAWLIAFSIPFTSLTGQPRLTAPQHWRANFTRTQTHPPVNSTWSPLAPGQSYFFLQSENFGTLELPLN